MRSGARSRLSASPSPDIAPGRSVCWAAAEPAAIAGWRHASELCGCRSFWGAGRSAERRSWPWFVCLPACTPVGLLVHGASSESCRSSALVALCAYLLPVRRGSGTRVWLGDVPELVPAACEPRGHPPLRGSGHAHLVLASVGLPLLPPHTAAVSRARAVSKGAAPAAVPRAEPEISLEMLQALVFCASP